MASQPWLNTTTAEMDASHKAMKGKDTSQGVSSVTRIKAIDRNNDGMLSSDENAAAAQKTFDGMDANHDGQLSVDEMRVGYDEGTGNSPVEK